ncbi:MAG: sulfatase [Bradymonadia bacterium]
MTDRRSPATHVRSRPLLFALLWGLMFGAGVAAAQGPQKPPPDTQPPNVVLLIIDTLRADHLGAYGYTKRPTSPTLDGLAKQSVVFERAYSASSWTRSALASMFSGQFVHEHKVYSERTADRLPNRVFTMTEFFANLGYDVGMFYTNPHFKFGMLQGARFKLYEWDGDASFIYNKALPWLGRHKNRSFFLVVHNLDPHDKYKYRESVPFSPTHPPIREARNLYEQSDRTGRGGKGIGCDRRTHGRVLSDSDLDKVKAAYDGEIAYLDNQIKRLLDQLTKLGLDNNTVVIVTADHGEEFLDHGGYWHGCTLHDELVRAPLMIRLPGGTAGRVSTPVSTVDIFPTLVDLIDPGALEELGLSGQSLLPAAQGKPLESRPQFMATGFRKSWQHAVVDGDYKLIVDGSTGAKALYNLKDDPKELRNLLELPLGFSAVYAEKAAQLEALLGDLPPRPTGGAEPEGGADEDGGLH